ncbi:MAG: sugar phosphate nucleotidyltransferase [Silicimonas sp.]|nr:sugar phosphate nucleotidyltransferase [Silicimonas sp.]
MRSVILPVAGKGTRLLPLTKVTPKELLPVFDKPVLQYAIDEAIAAGAERLVVVSHRMKPAIADYFNEDTKAVAALRRKESHDLADRLEQAGADRRIEVRLVYQDEALGLGHAILCGADHVLDGPVGVVLPDDVILGRGMALVEMAEAYRGGNMVAGMEVAAADVSKYGIFDLQGPVASGQSAPAAGMVEKPAPEVAPSRMAAIGRYILSPDIFDVLRAIPRGAGGEYQLTDAISRMIGQTDLSVFRFTGSRFDCGHHAGLLAASNARCAERAALPDARIVAA